MKHIKSVNEWFWSPEDGDDFAKKVIDIIKNENIDIEKLTNDTIIDNELYDVFYSMNIDNEKIFFRYDDGKYNIKVYDLISNQLKSIVNISTKYFNQIKQLYKDQIRIKNIKNLPDLSDLGRSTKKYNL